MSFWRPLVSTRELLEAAALRQRVKSLEAALASCQVAAARWTWGRTVLVGILIFAAGFTLGLYAGPLKDVVGGWTAAVGLAPARITPVG